MTIQSIRGNILESNAHILVNPVNCVGVMGKGLALQFKLSFPENYVQYRIACQLGLISPGRCFYWQETNRWIANFPTKRHWRDSSHLSDIEAGLADLVQFTRAHSLKSMAIPPLGCGLGGLQWDAVEPLIRSAFNGEAISVLLYPPR
jgi:O-acetyl-ADP-ribose deacetylase (regulator of RNase III)